jgi:hypothetical protein
MDKIHDVLGQLIGYCIPGHERAAELAEIADHSGIRLDAGKDGYARLVDGELRLVASATGSRRVTWAEVAA